MPKFDAFVGPAYATRNQRADCQRCINFYPELDEQTKEWRLVGTPGLKSWASGLAGAIRGMWVGEGRLFVAAGTYVYELNSAGTAVNSWNAGIGGGSSPVEIYPNGAQLLVVGNNQVKVLTGTEAVTPAFDMGIGMCDVAGTAVTWLSGDKFDPEQVGCNISINGSPAGTVAAYIDETHLTLSGSAGTQTNVGFAVTQTVTGSHACFLDGFFIVTVPSTKRINISNLRDGQQWDGLAYAFKEGYPDNLQTLLADHEELWMLGTETTEVWRNTGNADFPFQRDPGAFIHCGTAAQYAISRLTSGPAWLARDYRGGTIAMRAQGYIPVRVSTPAIEAEWSTYATTADAESFSYRDEGHEFWVISFPTAGKTWVFDAATNAWHERSSYGVGRWRGRWHAYIFGKHLVGDYASGTIWEMTATEPMDGGQIIQRTRRAPHIRDGLRRIFFHEFMLEHDTSSVLPTLTLNWSNDGGVNWQGTVGGKARIANGETSRYLATVWRRLGSSRDRVFEVVMTNTIAVPSILAAHVEAE